MTDKKFRGVFQHKDGGFIANIGHRGKHVYLGMFSSFEDAKAARLKAEVDLFGATFDRREMELCDDHAKIPLHGQRGKFYGWAIIDLDDIHVASTAWTIDPRGYVVGRPEGFQNSITLHRWLMLGAEKVEVTIDHRDRDKLNNRRTNLRICTQGENAKNTSIPTNNTSGAKGVSQTPGGRWRARIWLDRVEIHIGTFDSVEDASAAYDRAALDLHGEFASPNKAETTRAIMRVTAL